MTPEHPVYQLEPNAEPVESLWPLEAIPALSDLGVQVVAIGRGPAFEDELAAVADRNPAVAYHADASEPTARLAYAGADIFVAPSEFEPFGLAALIALRYGCVPVVRGTGGMLDTIWARHLGFRKSAPPTWFLRYSWSAA